ncbi:ABC transporter ATP-binding protein [Actinotalea sp. C106]|uniref:ABC transporter transmembrane domain-containing protein n=1 Tax=Actinotalea sp. C106 TaxID=2908644 RepID=UPI0020298ABF|nr:ABC transporter ATP-binding protein [Actinotalea sp. C106]
MRSLPLPDPGTPPLTSAAAYLWWVARRQGGLLLGSALVGIASAVSLAALPLVLGMLVDDGLDQGLSRELWSGVGLLLGVGLVQVVANVVGHRLDVENWLRAAFRTSQLVGHHVSRTGDAVTAELPTGEVVATVASDSLRVGELYFITARFVGGVVAYVAVAFVLLSSSVTLGVAVLVGLPTVAAVLALVVRPLQRRQAAQREASGRLTTLGADTVSGLRILRGIGGEEVFAGRYQEQSQKVRRAGVRVAQTQSLLDAMQALLPGLFLAAVVWFGARLAITGEITPGQLVTFYGYAAFLTEPLTAATQFVQSMTRARVGVRKILRVLRVPVTGADLEPGSGSASPVADGEGGTTMTDLTSGFTAPADHVTALVSADPDETATIATRLGLLGAEHAEAADQVLLDGRPLSDLGLAAVRRRVVVAESTPHLFTGLLREELDVRGTGLERELLAALEVADADDVLTSLPGGLDGEVAEKGRSLSGGQRQRLALARALLTDPEVLVLVEPTSAVDAHTEARIATRLAQARAGRTTVVVTASPLVLDQVDQVVLVEQGRVVAEGTHRGMLAHPDPTVSARYRAVVSRAAADTDQASDEAHAHQTDKEARHAAAGR